VLLADDNRTSALLAGASLAKLGCAVETASSFDEAVGKLSHTHFGLILLDQHLPGRGDLQDAVSRVRTHCPSPARVVVMSDREAAGWRRRDQPGDPDGFLAKPLSHASLAAVVETLA
jgi:CheY-like chemotaxis protein